MLENNQKEIILLKDLGMIEYGNQGCKTKFGLFKCFCGNEFKTRVQSIKRFSTKSCGCIGTNNKHKLTNHRLYATWKAMKARCNNSKSNDYKNYGGRGITVCDRWLDISNFIEDMYPSFQEGLTLDRKNLNGNYEPSNCRWVNRNIQASNTRKIRINNTSGYRGVTWNKHAKKWVARICLNFKRITLGYFDNAQDGALAYDNYILINNLEHTTNCGLN